MKLKRICDKCKEEFINDDNSYIISNVNFNIYLCNKCIVKFGKWLQYEAK